MTDRRTQRSAARTAVVWEVLRAALADRPDTAAAVLDLGGGTGGFAVPLAELGCVVEVVDPSPDSLAALERRAAEAGLGERVRARQGDAGDVLGMFGADAFDLVVCHSVLEVVDDAGTALRELVTVLRPGGVASVLVANRIGATVARVAAGRFVEAGQMLRSATGVAGPGDLLRRRFTIGELHELVAEAGLQLVSTHGVRVFADHAPDSVLDTDPGALDELIGLEGVAAADPAYFGVAAALHVLATKPR
jgi:S-adenosylmethionine-dependent methyltransferase